MNKQLIASLKISKKKPDIVRQDIDFVRKNFKKECSIETLEEMINFFPIICKSGENDDFLKKVLSVFNPLVASHHPYRKFDPSIILDVVEPISKKPIALALLAMSLKNSVYLLAPVNLNLSAVKHFLMCPNLKNP